MVLFQSKSPVLLNYRRLQNRASHEWTIILVFPRTCGRFFWLSEKGPHCCQHPVTVTVVQRGYLPILSKCHTERKKALLGVTGEVHLRKSQEWRLEGCHYGIRFEALSRQTVSHSKDASPLWEPVSDGTTDSRGWLILQGFGRRSWIHDWFGGNPFSVCDYFDWKLHSLLCLSIRQFQ